MGNCCNCSALLLAVVILASIAAAALPSTLSLSLSLLLNFFGWFAGESGGLEFDVKNRLISFAWYAENKKITTTMHPAMYGWHFGQHGFLVSKKKIERNKIIKNTFLKHKTLKKKSFMAHTHTHLIWNLIHTTRLTQFCISFFHFFGNFVKNN